MAFNERKSVPTCITKDVHFLVLLTDIIDIKLNMNLSQVLTFFCQYVNFSILFGGQRVRFFALLVVLIPV